MRVYGDIEVKDDLIVSDQLDGSLKAGQNSIVFTETVNTPTNGAVTIDWNKGNKQVLNLNANTTVTFVNPPGVCNLLLRIKQDATGGRTVTMPTLRTPGGIPLSYTTSPNAEDVLMLYYTGSYYIAAILNDVR